MTKMTNSLLFAALIVSAPASADMKTYPGAMCLPGENVFTTNGLGDIVGLAHTREETGEILNLWNLQGIDLVCPYVRDSVNDAIETAWIWVLDQNDGADTDPQNNVSCTLNSITEEGELFASAGPLVTAGANNEPQMLEFGPVDAADGGHYAIYCTVPRLVHLGPEEAPFPSGVLSYGIDEQGFGLD